MTDTEKYKSFDDVKCLWMKCGAVDYKICDLNFDCENCEFDKRISSEIKTKDFVHEGIENVFDLVQHTVQFTHPHYHFNGGLLVRNFIADTYYLGLEPFISKFIDRQSRMQYCSPDISVNKGEPVLNISNGWGEINVLSPFSFDFVEKLDLKDIASNNLHWFAIIETESHEILSNSVNKKAYFDKLYDTKLYVNNLLKASEGVGETMYDGGAVLENWPEILGKTAYRNLMEKLFS